MVFKSNKMTSQNLRHRADWVRRQTLLIHRCAPETRLASSLSAVEIFTVLYYGGIIKVNPQKSFWPKRDRFIISKGHGSVSLYPILADLGFFSQKELFNVCKTGSLLGSIPDSNIPGFETINGSLGHGLGVACGVALALRNKRRKEKVFVLLGDGELYEGSVWEAMMFAGQHKLSNLILLIDNNKISMLDYCRNIIDLEPLENKFRDFGWKAARVDGHNTVKLWRILRKLKAGKGRRPKVLICDTVKGKGVSCFESDSLCHIKSLKSHEVDALINEENE